MTDKAKKAVEVKKTERELMQEFLEKYQALCDEYNLRLVITPAWISRDDGTFSLVLQTSVGKQPEKK